MNESLSKASFAVRWALLHLLVCVVVAVVAVGLVFLFWYPTSLAPIVGVGKILGLLIIVDVVCGPLLTAVLAKPTKPRRELWMDLTLVATIQLGALGYGLWSLYAARPVAIAFEVDRLVIVTANQVQPEPMDDAISHQIDRDAFGLQIVSLREPKSSTEYLESLDQSIQGVTPAMRPDWWRPIGEAHLEIGRRAKPLAHLVEKHPDKAGELQAQALKSGIPFDSLRYLPLVSNRSLEWIALLDAADKIVGHVNVDGFE